LTKDIFKNIIRTIKTFDKSKIILKRGDIMKINKEKLELLLARKCISGYELMKKAGLQSHTFSRIRNGFANLRPKTVGKIAIALDVSVEELLEK